MADDIEVTQAEIDGVAAVFDEVADDEIARSSAYIMTKKLKRVFVSPKAVPPPPPPTTVLKGGVFKLK